MLRKYIIRGLEEGWNSISSGGTIDLKVIITWSFVMSIEHDIKSFSTLFVIVLETQKMEIVK